MKVALTVQERLIAGMILPRQSNFITLKIVTKFQEQLGFTEEEHKLLQFRNPGEQYIDKNTKKEVVVPPGTIHWEENVPKKEFDIGEKATDIIAKALKELDNKKQLGMQHMSLYEKFVENRSDIDG